jgi:hypothetical protein
MPTLYMAVESNIQSVSSASISQRSPANTRWIRHAARVAKDRTTVAAFQSVALVAVLAAAAPFFLIILARFLRNFGDSGRDKGAVAAGCKNE